MNMSTSECCSGCESGWTMYLDESSNSADQFGRIADEDFIRRQQGANHLYEEDDDDDDDDWSMVSDASSGPPHFHEDEDCFNETRYFGFAASSEKTKRGKQKGKTRDQQNLPCLDDDTASSPVLITSSKKNRPPSNNQVSAEPILGLSQGFSATHFKGKSALRKQFGFFQASEAGNADSEKSVRLQRKNRQ